MNKHKAPETPNSPWKWAKSYTVNGPEKQAQELLSSTSL